MGKMTIVGVFSLTTGFIMLISFVFQEAFTKLPMNIPELRAPSPELGALASVALIIMGSIFIVGGALLKAQTELLHKMTLPYKNLENIEQKLATLAIEAKHSVQEFQPNDKIRNYRGYEIFQKHRYFYIRDVNAQFFTLRGAEHWVDKNYDRWASEKSVSSSPTQPNISSC